MYGSTLRGAIKSARKEHFARQAGMHCLGEEKNRSVKEIMATISSFSIAVEFYSSQLSYS